MTEIQNPKPVLVIEYWNLRFVCNLVLGVWNFKYSITPSLHYSSKLAPQRKTPGARTSRSWKKPDSLMGV